MCIRDSLVTESGFHHNVEVDFFGGEPLMNWNVIVDTMAYARSAYPLKKWRFTLTTNGSLLRDGMFPVLEANDVSVVLSLDGGRRVNDANRVLRTSVARSIPSLNGYGTSRGRAMKVA